MSFLHSMFNNEGISSQILSGINPMEKIVLLEQINLAMKANAFPCTFHCQIGHKNAVLPVQSLDELKKLQAYLKK